MFTQVPPMSTLDMGSSISLLGLQPSKRKIILYGFFIALPRLLFLIFSPWGYIHPDEVFQSVEVIASYFLKIAGRIPWEYADCTHPYRSIVSPFLTSGIPYLSVATLSKYFATSTTSTSSPVTMVWSVRIWLFLVSLAIDGLFLFACRKYLQSRQPLHTTQSIKNTTDTTTTTNNSPQPFIFSRFFLLLVTLFLATSWPLSFIMNMRPLSNTVESWCVGIILSCYLLLQSKLHEYQYQYQQQQEQQQQRQQQQPTKTMSSSTLHGTRRLASCMGIVAAIGFFARFTLPVFILPIAGVLVVELIWKPIKGLASQSLVVNDSDNYRDSSSSNSGSSNSDSIPNHSSSRSVQEDDTSGSASSTASNKLSAGRSSASHIIPSNATSRKGAILNATGTTSKLNKNTETRTNTHTTATHRNTNLEVLRKYMFSKHFQVLAVGIISFFLTCIFLAYLDSLIFGAITASAATSDQVKNVVSTKSTKSKKSSSGTGSWWWWGGGGGGSWGTTSSTISSFFTQLIWTPFAMAKYNSDPANLAHHGTHPRWNHLLINMHIMYGPAWTLLCIASIVMLVQKVWERCGAAKRGSGGDLETRAIMHNNKKRTNEDYDGVQESKPLQHNQLAVSSKNTTTTSNTPKNGNVTILTEKGLIQFVQLCASTVFTTLFFLSLAPHQEPRFLLPLTYPMSVVLAFIVLKYFPFLFPQDDQHARNELTNSSVDTDAATATTITSTTTPTSTTTAIAKNCQSQQQGNNPTVCKYILPLLLVVLWVFFNVVAGVFYGVLHQAGVHPTLVLLSSLSLPISSSFFNPPPPLPLSSASVGNTQTVTSQTMSSSHAGASLVSSWITFPSTVTLLGTETLSSVSAISIVQQDVLMQGKSSSLSVVVRPALSSPLARIPNAPPIRVIFYSTYTPSQALLFQKYEGVSPGFPLAPWCCEDHAALEESNEQSYSTSISSPWLSHPHYAATSEEAQKWTRLCRGVKLSDNPNSGQCSDILANLIPTPHSHHHHHHHHHHPKPRVQEGKHLQVREAISLSALEFELAAAIRIRTTPAVNDGRGSALVVVPAHLQSEVESSLRRVCVGSGSGSDSGDGAKSENQIHIQEVLRVWPHVSTESLPASLQEASLLTLHVACAVE